MVKGPFLSPGRDLAFWGRVLWESAAQSPQSRSSLPDHTAKQGAHVKEEGSWVHVYDLRERNEEQQQSQPCPKLRGLVSAQDTEHYGSSARCNSFCLHAGHPVVFMARAKQFPRPLLSA